LVIEVTIIRCFTHLTTTITGKKTAGCFHKDMDALEIPKSKSSTSEPKFWENAKIAYSKSCCSGHCSHRTYLCQGCGETVARPRGSHKNYETNVKLHWCDSCGKKCAKCSRVDRLSCHPYYNPERRELLCLACGYSSSKVNFSLSRFPKFWENAKTLSLDLKMVVNILLFFIKIS